MIVSIVSLGIPSVLYTISFLLLLGKTGPLNQFVIWLTDASEPPFNVYSLGGMILIQGIEYTPLCFLLLSSRVPFDRCGLRGSIDDLGRGTRRRHFAGLRSGLQFPESRLC